MTTSYSGEQFLQALSDNAFKPSLIKTGMAKRADDDQAILFTERGCSEWIRIPLALISQVVHVSTSTCRDHSHPVVQIHFKEVPDGNEAAKVFAALSNTPRSAVGPSQLAEHHRHSEYPGQRRQTVPIADMPGSDTFGGDKFGDGINPGIGWVTQIECNCVATEQQWHFALVRNPRTGRVTRRWVSQEVCTQVACYDVPRPNYGGGGGDGDGGGDIIY
jgi:hypothetical protein